MTDGGAAKQARDWLRLMIWMSPAFPVGGFAYSSGLEAAVAEGWVGNATQLTEWIDTSLSHGALWNDAVLLCAAMAEDTDMAAVNALALALAGSPGRLLETSAQGSAFAQAAAPWAAETDIMKGEVALPVAIAQAARASVLAPSDTVLAFLSAATGNQVQAAIRLGVLGQGEGVTLLRGLEGLLVETAARAAKSRLEDLGGAAMLAEIAALRHDRLEGRLFRS